MKFRRIRLTIQQAFGILGSGWRRKPTRKKKGNKMENKDKKVKISKTISRRESIKEIIIVFLITLILAFIAGFMVRGQWVEVKDFKLLKAEVVQELKESPNLEKK